MDDAFQEDILVQAYDLIMLIVIGMATIFGAIKGFAWQVASLASVIVSYIVAYRFRFEVGEMIQAKPPWNQFLAMLILYVGTSFVIWVGFRLLSGAIDQVRLKEFDRHLGAGFGLAKGLLYCLLITMFAMSLLGPQQQSAICQSRSGYYISVALDRGVGILPKEIHDVVGPYLTGLDEKLNNHDGHIHEPGQEEPSQSQSPLPGNWGVAGETAREHLGEIGRQLGNELGQQFGDRLGVDPRNILSGQSQTGQQTNPFPGTFPTTNQPPSGSPGGYGNVLPQGYSQPGYSQPGYSQPNTGAPGFPPSAQPGSLPASRQPSGPAPFPGTSNQAPSAGQRFAQPGSGIPSTGYQR